MRRQSRPTGTAVHAAPNGALWSPPPPLQPPVRAASGSPARRSLSRPLAGVL